MWLLKFHIAISILCMLSCIGVKVVFKERIKRFSAGESKPKRKRYRNWLIFFCPGINVMSTVVVWWMVFCDDEAVKRIISKKDD